MTKPKENTVTDQIADLHRRLDDLAAERAADRPGDADDPAVWHRRETDRAQLELAAAQRIADLRRDADNTTALVDLQPPVDDDTCSTCGRDQSHGRGVRTADGITCRGCSERDAGERALIRSARMWPTDEIAARLAALPDSDVGTLYARGSAFKPHRYDLHVAIGQAAQRRRKPLVHHRVDGRQ